MNNLYNIISDETVLLLPKNVVAFQVNRKEYTRVLNKTGKIKFNNIHYSIDDMCRKVQVS